MMTFTCLDCSKRIRSSSLPARDLMRLPTAAANCPLSSIQRAFHIFLSSGATMLTTTGRGGVKCFRIILGDLPDKKRGAKSVSPLIIIIHAYLTVAFLTFSLGWLLFVRFFDPFGRRGWFDGILDHDSRV